ncbi:prepilin-type N-terminal cleavage/methylation domain-containing protein [Parahaliea maris]|uniref:Type II secretion system protein H n=1 Tax=Parahaliea maris TaxID=2716870 RepID=A0A5C8ZU73_9GAMM|nr:GspH/FimT family pseudopilin [Parahaliea maris]TXS91324.1 prepilin-type N-terminal cleavage/methylation domain-containing protein [Parahaliea maris]
MACRAVKVKTLTWATGAKAQPTTQVFRRSQPARGFTLLELVVALAIAGLLMALVVPAAGRLYSGMQYREGIREAMTVLTAARMRAITSGKPQDVEVRPDKRSIYYAGKTHTLPSGVTMAVHSARELNREGTGVIRFYPEGGASGGGIDIESSRGDGVSVEVDWLTGAVSQARYASN